MEVCSGSPLQAIEVVAQTPHKNLKEGAKLAMDGCQKATDAGANHQVSVVDMEN